MSWNKVPVRVGGLDFSCARECAEHFGINEWNVHYHLRMGNPDGVLKVRPGDYRSKPVKCLNSGKEWESMTECAKSEGISRRLLGMLIGKGSRYAYVDGVQ